MKKKLFGALFAALLCLPTVSAADPALPSSIQQGNILHCFDWPISAVKAELTNIKNAGFGAVQLSPLQRPDIKTGYAWHDLYRPYDLAFKASSGMGSAEDLKSLCAEASKLGIKVIVDVVANHVDKTAGYHDTWWDSSGRVRWNGGINYGDRYSITHGQLGDYGDVNSEDAAVIARAKAYVQELADMGVKGIRWDAAKHIGLPSEGCNFWKEVTSVAGVWHYGEILDAPGPNAGIIKEYATYMSVTDNRYCNYAARDNGGIPTGYGGDWAVNYGLGNKCIYWAESHDTYSNDEWSQSRSQAVIDRAYAAYACRNNEAALYFSRPSTTGFNNIKVGKGSTHFTEKCVAEVNKFRNAMVGKKDYFTHSNGNISVTREKGGAVIVMKGSGNVSIANGGGYCPTGEYTDRVAGGKFTVTASTISGTVGSTGIAVLWKDENGGNGGGDDPTPPGPGPDPVTGSMWILGNLGTAGWSTTPGTGVAMTQDGTKYTAKGVNFVVVSGETKCYFNLTDYVGSTWDDLNMNANRYGAATEGAPITLNTPATVVKYANNVDASGCLSWTIAPGTYDVTFDSSAMTLTVTGQGSNPDPGPDPTDGVTITGDYNLAYSGDKANVHYWGGSSQSTWPGVAMTSVQGSDGKTYKVAKVASGTTGCLFNTNGDSNKTGDLKYTSEYVMNDNGATTTKVTFKNGGDDPTPPGPDPVDGFTIYYDNSASNWTQVNIHYWSTPNTTWPGTPMTKVEGNIWKYTFTSDPSGLSGFLFCNAAGTDQTADWTKAPEKNHLYKGSGNKGAVTDGGLYGNDDPVDPVPVVTASPASGTTFAESVNVTLTVSPAATIYYTLNGATPTTSSTKYTSAIALTETTTVKTLAVTAAGKQNIQSFTYTKKQGGDDPIVVPGNNLITDYYKVNPNGQVGSNRTVSMSFNGQKSTTALNNWTSADLIAQGVARDVAQAMKGNHERPIVDSYAIYAAYDNDNLYLGVQFVYTVWDLYGEGKQPGESKPYNMDGHMVWAFDLNPAAQFDGYINGTGPIWNEQQKGAKFANGVDAVWCGSTKPGVGTPGFFIPTPDGHASYDAAYCKSIGGSYYGYADGLLPSITQIWGQKDFNFDPEVLKGNTGFVDLSGEIDKTAHTFYEWKFPLSTLGVTAQQIRDRGIGVMYLDKYGSSPVGGTPYDPAYFDNVKGSYSQDPSSSEEKEDEDIITYAPARIGKLASSGVEDINIDLPAAGEDAAPVYYNLQGARVQNPQTGLYIVVRGSKVTKEIVR